MVAIYDVIGIKIAKYHDDSRNILITNHNSKVERFWMTNN
jgi:hypothetical protein